MPSLVPSTSQQKVVKSSASGRKIFVHIQQLTGVSNGQGGLVNGGTWADVPGLSNVQLTFSTWTPYQKFVGQQIYPGVTSRGVMKYRRSVNITNAMRVIYGDHIYMIRGVSNFNEANTDIVLFLEELQATGSNRQ